MRTILLADKAHRNYHAIDFFRVFSDSILDELNGLGIGLESEPVFLEEFDRKRSLLRETDILLSNWGMPELTLEQVAEYLPRVRAVFYAGGDVRPFAAPYFQRGARVFSTGHANAVPASEYALAQILMANKGTQRNLRLYRDEETYVQSRERSTALPGNYRATVGILGVGRVGSRLAKLLKGFDLKVYGCDPFLPPHLASELGLEMVEAEELFALCDTVSCHLPEWSTLRGYVTEDLLLSMPENASFINAAQASVVDQEGLIRALIARPDLTAILDSTDPMPLPALHPLLTLPGAIVTPHTAGSFGGETERMGEEIVSALRDYLSGTPSIHEIHRERVPE